MTRRKRPGAPTDPRLYRAEVLRSAQLSPHWQRVTVSGDALASFPWRGDDHWFRLFVQRVGQTGFELPTLSGDEWWKPYLALPEPVRPYCANYTVADHRAASAELDIDLVLHRDSSGRLEGEAAQWACRAKPGDPVALLDQGTIFDLPDDATEVVLVTDETGLPGVRNILEGLASQTVGRAVIEIPTPADRGDVTAPDGIKVTWLDRSDVPAVRNGAMALAELDRWTGVDPAGYAYVVGESGLATAGRRRLHRLGLSKKRITFSGYWRKEADLG